MTKEYRFINVDVSFTPLIGVGNIFLHHSHSPARDLLVYDTMIILASVHAAFRDAISGSRVTRTIDEAIFVRADIRVMALRRRLVATKKIFHAHR